MKKILMVLAVAVCAVQAQAKITVSSAQCYAGKEGDGKTYDSTAGDKYNTLSYYEAYGVSSQTLKDWGCLSKEFTVPTKSGSVNQTTVDTVAAWVKDHFSTVYEYLTSGSSGVYTGTVGASGNNKQITFDGVGHLGDARWVVEMYTGDEDSDEYAFRVISLASKSSNWSGDGTETSSNNLTANTGNSFYASPAWLVVSIPEPTSGLLLLLGVAGLALKRKRA